LQVWRGGEGFRKKERTSGKNRVLERGGLWGL